MATCLYSEGDGRFGFPNLATFNLALLAKQGWQLLHFPNSLIVRVLKAKYYQHSEFLGLDWVTYRHILGKVYGQLERL